MTKITQLIKAISTIRIPASVAKTQPSLFFQVPSCDRSRGSQPLGDLASHPLLEAEGSVVEQKRMFVRLSH